MSKKIVCPNCGKDMSKIDTNVMENFSEGSGWGTEFIYVCLNDKCTIFVEGWEHVAEYYGSKASFRCIFVPGEKGFSTTIVFSQDALKGLVITEKHIRRKKRAMIKGRLKVVLDYAVLEIMDDEFKATPNECRKWREKLDREITKVLWDTSAK